MRVILRRIVLALVGTTLLAVAASIVTIALALALYGVLRPWLGAPGAAAGVALAAVLLLVLVGFAMDRCLLGPCRSKAADEPDMIQKLIAMAQERPIMAVGALVGAIFLAIRNPTLTAALVKAFLDPGGRPGKKG